MSKEVQKFENHEVENNIYMVLISEYLAADSSPDASADALAIINLGYSCQYCDILLF